MKVIKNTIKELPENYSWDDIFSIGIGVPTGTQNMFKIYFEIPKLKSQSHSTETGQPTYTLSQIRQAGKEGEVNHLDVEHIIDLLKEQPDGQKEPLYRWVTLTPDNIPADAVNELFRHKETKSRFNTLDDIEDGKAFFDCTLVGYNLDEIEWLCKVETPEQDESVCAHYYDFFAPNDSGNVVCKKCGKVL